MPEADRTAELRHAISNPLAALLTEVQLTLTGPAHLEDDIRQSLQDIEKLALRMRDILRESRQRDPASGPRPPG